VWIRFVRVYTIHPPQFYSELRRYNTVHRTAPLYLVQGVYLPDDVTYVTRRDLYAPGQTAAFTDELADASAAVHGDLRRAAARGRANGTWTSDVSPWLAAWLVGVEWDGQAVAASDLTNARRTGTGGRYFTATADATPTERWLAGRMDELAAREARRGTSAPVAFVNWPATDPLGHAPWEPLADREDAAGVDANRVRATAAWPGGTFASYHLYPYYPDFQRHTPDYRRVATDGKADPYAGYLTALKRHHAGADLPVMVTEFGVPSSIGSAHFGPLGRDQGGHDERDAMAVDAGLLRIVHRLGMAGAILFSWTDEWFKAVWNTRPRQAVVAADRRALWHDPLTNEQWFGVLAQDAVRTGRQVVHEATTGVQRVAVDTDASYVYLELTLERAPDAPVRLGFDVVPGGLVLPGSPVAAATPTSDYAVVIDPSRRMAQAYVRGGIDPVLLDELDEASLRPPAPTSWVRQRMTANRRHRTAALGDLPAEFVDVGTLRPGEWDPSRPDYDSRSTWQLGGATVRLRLPWSMLGLGDPSSATAVIPRNGRPAAVPVTRIGLLADLGSGPGAIGSVRWAGWQRVQASERVKRGVQPLVDAYVEVSR
jgi:hypothetical protein